MAKVIISAGTVSLTVETRDTPTAEALLATLGAAVRDGAAITVERAD